MADVEITVAPAPGGWVVRSPFSDFGLMFLSGGRAEAKASELAVRAAALGLDAHLEIRDRGQTVIASRLYPGRSWTQADL